MDEADILAEMLRGQPVNVSREDWESFARNAAHLTLHPATQRLRDAFAVLLPPDVQATLQAATNAYNARNTGTPFDVIRQRSTDEDARSFFDVMTMGVQEGIRAAFYHLGRFLELEQAAKSIAQEYRLASPLSQPTTQAIVAPMVVFEYESFTLLSRATLDRLTYFFGLYFDFDRQPGNIIKLANVLRNERRRDLTAQALCAVVDKHRAYLDTQVGQHGIVEWTERDTLAHRTYIPFGQTINVQFDRSAAEAARVFLAYPAMDWHRDAGNVLQERFEMLAVFLHDAVLAWLALPTALDSATK